MKDSSKTKQALTEELASLRRRIGELEKSEVEKKKIEEALRESEGRLNTLYQESPIPTFTWQKRGDDFSLVDFNRAAVRITDGKAHDFLGKRAEELYQYQPQVLEDMRQCFTEHSVIRRDILSKHFAPGKSLSVHYAFIPPDLIIVHTEDQTDHKRAEDALRKSEERYRTILENIEDGCFEVDIAGNLTFFNDSVCRMNGYSRAEMMGMNNRQYTDKENSQILYQAFNKVFRTGEPSTGIDYEIIGKDGTKRYIESSISLIRNTSGQPIGFRGIMRNITERKRMEEALKNSERRYRELSVVDDLTQLYNSRYFYHQLKMEMDRVDRYKQPLTLLLLDLDDFKRFNDAYGHVEGDQVLLRLGQVVKRCLRRTDSAYRYGGEEFTIIMPITTSEAGAVTAERIRTEFRKEIFSPVPGQDVHVTVSIGLAQYKTQEDIKAFVHRVDQLMYQGKKNGKDKVCSGS